MRLNILSLAPILLSAVSITASPVPNQITMIPSRDESSSPTSYGVVVFPTFQAIDVFGPLDALNILSLSQKLDLSIISSTLDPVSTQARSPMMNPFKSTMAQSIVPTHTFKTAPRDLEVLLVPGGIGTVASDLEPLVQYVKEAYPKLRYILSVCTGAGILARAGILDGRSATTNKRSWDRVVKLGPKVDWVPEARWVVDGNVWTSSGVSAGIDLMLAFIDSVYGTKVGENVSNGMEYERTMDWRNDPFAKIIDVTKP